MENVDHAQNNDNILYFRKYLTLEFFNFSYSIFCVLFLDWNELFTIVEFYTESKKYII